MSRGVNHACPRGFGCSCHRAAGPPPTTHPRLTCDHDGRIESVLAGLVVGGRWARTAAPRPPPPPPAAGDCVPPAPASVVATGAVAGRWNTCASPSALTATTDVCKQPQQSRERPNHCAPKAVRPPGPKLDTHTAPYTSKHYTPCHLRSSRRSRHRLWARARHTQTWAPPGTNPDTTPSRTHVRGAKVAQGVTRGGALSGMGVGRGWWLQHHKHHKQRPAAHLEHQQCAGHSADHDVSVAVAVCVSDHQGGR